jgi:hypothetical protein
MYDFRDKKLAKVECVYPPSSASPIVPFVPSFKTGPNVCPLSVLILAAGSFDVWLRSTML